MVICIHRWHGDGFGGAAVIFYSVVDYVLQHGGKIQNIYRCGIKGCVLFKVQLHPAVWNIQPVIEAATSFNRSFSEQVVLFNCTNRPTLTSITCPISFLSRLACRPITPQYGKAVFKLNDLKIISAFRQLVLPQPMPPLTSIKTCMVERSIFIASAHSALQPVCLSHQM